MKKTIFFVCCLFSLAAMAEDKVASYSMSYFDGKAYDIQASKPEANGSFNFYIYVEGRTNDRICLDLKSENVPAFKEALETIKVKFAEWKTTAVENNVTDITKDFPCSFPKMNVAWHTSQWWFTFNRTFTPKFFVFKDGRCAVVTSAKVVSSENRYIDQTFYLVFEDNSEIDTLINGLDCDAVVKHYNQKQNAAELFN